MVDEGMLYVFTQMLLIARLECVAHGVSHTFNFGGGYAMLSLIHNETVVKNHWLTNAEPRFSRFAPSVTEDSDDDRDESTADEVLDLFRRIQSEDNTANAPEAPSASAPEESDSVRSRLFRMESLKQVINAAVIAGSHYHGLSTLYHEEGTDGYYLILTQGEEDREVFDRVCNVISEYGIPKRSTPASLTFLEEHCSTLIAEHALQRLANTSM